MGRFTSLKKENETAKKVDQHNERMEKSFDSEVGYISKDFAKSIWKHYKHKFIDLGQKGAR